jgi:hypothetical protein
VGFGIVVLGSGEQEVDLREMKMLLMDLWREWADGGWHFSFSASAFSLSAVFCCWGGGFLL